MTRTLILLLCLIGFTGCAGSSQFLTTVGTIETGSSKKTVEAILGKPQNIQSKEPIRKRDVVTEWAWQYCSSSMTAEIYAVIRFEKNYVTNIETYKVQRLMQLNKSCSDYFKDIDWNAAPAPETEETE
ncbi:MAG: hypothetical protein IME99_04265 [Proteobacteria bacterium]|nr:hypothetical protein [Pseudomonadota bacterium]